MSFGDMVVPSQNPLAAMHTRADTGRWSTQMGSLANTEQMGSLVNTDGRWGPWSTQMGS